MIRNSPRKTGIFTYDFYPFIGGIGRYVYNIYLNKNEKRLVFFSNRRNSLVGHFYLKNPLFFLKNIGLSIVLNLTINHIIKAHQLNQINIHSGPGGILFIRKPKIPVVITSHHTYYQEIQKASFNPLKKIYLFFEKLTYKNATKIICTLPENKLLLIKRYAISGNKIDLVPCSIDPKQFYPMDIEKIPHSILYIGRFDRRKGLEFLLEAFKLVVRKKPESRLYLGGKGKELQRIKEIVRNYKIGSHVIFLGFVPEAQLNAWYNKAQIVILPSQFEGFGITLIEAMATGARVIGTNVDGIRSIIIDGKNGRLVDYGNVNHLSEIIHDLLEQNSRPMTNISNIIRKEYDSRQVSRNYIKLLESVK
ncbi:MAG: hypothetical protein DRH26_19010 [Deltaproteobacteria bacterium]|nr:MAG: hypothetical protein DRH26_19010 [Deltaproteobacteria bacterium]